MRKVRLNRIANQLCQLVNFPLQYRNAVTAMLRWWLYEQPVIGRHRHAHQQGYEEYHASSHWFTFSFGFHPLPPVKAFR